MSYFELNTISGRFGSTSDHLIIGPKAYHVKNKQLCPKFWWSMVRFGSIQISGPLSAEPISTIGSGMSLGHLVQVSGLGSVLPGLNRSIP